jgi:hypothetical protein
MHYYNIFFRMILRQYLNMNKEFEVYNSGEDL